MIDDYERLAVPNNLLSRLDALEAAVRALQTRDTSANTLDELVDDTGVIRNGLMAFGTGDPLATTDGDFSGLVFAEPGIEIDGVSYELVGMDLGVVQIGIDNTGTLLAGGGNVVVDADGVAITAAATKADANSVNFRDSTGGLVGDLYTIRPATGLARSATYLNAIGIGGTANTAGIILTGYDATTDSVSTIDLSASTVTIAQKGIKSGTYTPSLNNVTNIASSQAYSCQYIQFRDVVTVSGRVDIDATATGAIQLRMSIPVASNLANQNEAGGVAASGAVNQPLAISANAANDDVQFDGIVTDVANRAYFFQFMYRVN